jgi:hypothetical protein
MNVQEGSKTRIISLVPVKLDIVPLPVRASTRRLEGTLRNHRRLNLFTSAERLL